MRVAYYGRYRTPSFEYEISDAQNAELKHKFRSSRLKERKFSAKNVFKNKMLSRLMRSNSIVLNKIVKQKAFAQTKAFFVVEFIF